MRCITGLCLLGLGMGACAEAPPTERATRSSAAELPPTSAPAPYFKAREQRVDYVGPGRDAPVPGNVTEVKIGWFGPAKPDHPTAGSLWQAATLAIEEANAAGGWQGRPFRLVPAWSENPWGTGVRDVTRLVYEQQVRAIVGAPDSASAHLTEQVVAKARLVFLNPVATDKTANLVNVPWIFSLAPGDHQFARPLADAISRKAADAGFVLITATDHGSRQAARELLNALEAIDRFPTRQLAFAPGATDFSAQLTGVRESEPAAVVLLADAVDSAAFVRALRKADEEVPIFGGPATGRRVFLERAGPNAEGIVFPMLWDPVQVGAPADEFRQRFVERWGAEPDYAAAHTYDAMNILIAAVREAGLNRVRIRDAIRERSPFDGATGTIAWDNTGHNERSVTLGTIREGELISRDREKP